MRLRPLCPRQLLQPPHKLPGGPAPAHSARGSLYPEPGPPEAHQGGRVPSVPKPQSGGHSAALGACPSVSSAPGTPRGAVSSAPGAAQTKEQRSSADTESSDGEASEGRAQVGDGTAASGAPWTPRPFSHRHPLSPPFFKKVRWVAEAKQSQKIPLPLPPPARSLQKHRANRGRAAPKRGGGAAV